MSDWTPDTLKEHLERMITDQDRRIEAAHLGNKAAISKAEVALERRLDLLNEFRAQSVIEQTHFARKDLVEQRLDRLESSHAKFYGAIVVVAFIGLTNLLKIWVG